MFTIEDPVFQHNGQMYYIPVEDMKLGKIIFPDGKLYKATWTDESSPALKELHFSSEFDYMPTEVAARESKAAIAIRLQTAQQVENEKEEIPMSEETKKSGKKLAVMAAVGTAMGITAVILASPKARKKIADAGSAALKFGKELVQEGKDLASEAATSVKGTASSAVEKGKKVSAEGLDYLAAKAGNLSEKLKGEKPADAPAPEEKKE